MKQVTLHSSWANPFSKSVEIALKIKGVSFSLIEQDLFNPSLEMRKMSPLFPYVPLLVHDGETISETSIIIEYIDETWKGKSLFPKAPRDRAKTRSLIKFIELKCFPAVMRVCWDREWGAARKTLEQNANNCLKALEDELNTNGKKFFGGDTIGAADISAVFVALWANVNAEANAIKLLVRNDQFPLLRKWTDNFLSNTFVRETLPDRDMLLSYHQKIHPQDFRQPNNRRRTKLIDQHGQKLAQDSQQNVERLEVDSGDCCGILRKMLDRQKLSNLVFPAELSK